MKNAMGCLLALLVAASALAVDENDQREEDRVKDAGVVMKEVLNIPDDIPQDLLDKAECVVVLPSKVRALVSRWAARLPILFCW
jgi:lipid-binding SYLF domain-containing protein